MFKKFLDLICVVFNHPLTNGNKWIQDKQVHRVCKLCDSVVTKVVKK